MNVVSKATPMTPPVTVDMTATLDTAIDGSSTAGKMTTSGTIAGKGEVENMGMKFTMEMNFSGEDSQERSAEK
jgi:hypothetical protein